MTWFETGRGVPNASLLVLCSRLSPLWHWNASKLLTVRYLFAIFPNPIAECIFPTFGHFQFSLCEPWITGVIALYFASSVLYQQFSMKSSIQKWRICLLHSHENECNWKERREAKNLLLAAGLLISWDITFTGFFSIPKMFEKFPKEELHFPQTEIITWLWKTAVFCFWSIYSKEIKCKKTQTPMLLVREIKDRKEIP